MKKYTPAEEIGIAIALALIKTGLSRRKEMQAIDCATAHAKSIVAELSGTAIAGS